MTKSADPDLKKPTDLDLHCLQRQGIPGISRTKVKSVVSSQNIKLQDELEWI